MYILKIKLIKLIFQNVNDKMNIKTFVINGRLSK